MERREQYDPEDIEALLQERSFDELLEEERAYVLRHLSGRQEYEHMRSLLLQVREDDHLHQPIEAAHRVRANVMQAFRDQQQPQWRIWLNSIAALFIPREGSAMWRPALALGMLVILFGAGFFLVNGPLSNSREELAEVRRQKAEEPLPRKAPAQDTVQATIAPAAPETSESVAEDAGEQEEPATPIARPESPPPAARNFETALSGEAPVLMNMKEMEVQEMEVDMMEERMAADQIHDGTDDTVTYSHEVTREEFARNQSMANASGQVRARSITESDTKLRKQKAADASDMEAVAGRPLSQDPGLLDLLGAGW